MEFNATFIVAFISFVIFTVIMNIILYKPINDIIAKRKNYIDNNYNKADENNKEAQNVLNKRLDELSKARHSAKEEVDKKISLVKNQKEEITKKAQLDAKNNLERERLESINSSNAAKEALGNEIKNLAQMISDRFLKPEEKICDIDRGIIDKIMQEK